MLFLLTGRVSQGLDIQHHDLDVPFGQQLDNLATDTASAACYDDDLLRPVILVVDPVVQDLSREVVVDPPDKAKHQKLLEAGVGQWVEDGPVLALLSVLGQEKQRENELRVERRVADDFEDRVSLEALAGEETVVHGHCDDSASSVSAIVTWKR